MDTRSLSRRLSAILAADVVGYSHLMASDEVGALAALNKHREVIFNPVVERCNGRIVKLMGDGTLVEFNSVVDAVECARAIQQAIAEMPDAENSIVLRIGINLGDIILQDDDIFGDGVNIASRLEPLARAGGICISSVVNENVRSRVEMTFQDGGKVALKNMERSVRVFHWHPDLSPENEKPDVASTLTNQTIRTASIAVLPFNNMSGDPEQEYFSDGISEDIITDLSKVSGLAVIARNSSFAYKGKVIDLRKVGRELGVTSVLEGSVRRAGQRVRITAQLIDAATGEHLWADRFDRELTDIFAVQDEVTLEIVSALKIRLTPEQRAQITGVGTTNLEAHQEYMRMRGFLFFPGMDTQLWQKAIAAGERSIELDPDYADGYAALAMMHLLDFHNHWSGRDSEEAMQNAIALADRAYNIAPNDRWPNHVSAVVARWTGQLELAEELITKAMANNADYSLGLFTRGEIALGRGDLLAAITDLERAIQLDPAYRHQYLQFLAMAHLLMGHYETAALMFRERVFLVKDTDVGRAWLAAALGHTGEIEEARKVWADLQQINPQFSFKTRLARLTFSDPTYEARVLEGMAKAGLSNQL
jgi:adenylate cyclase